MWVRGLKQEAGYNAALLGGVAPHVGAWIETSVAKKTPSEVKVAPHVGAWIETFGCLSKSLCRLVAPHVGAWIETEWSG